MLNQRVIMKRRPVGLPVAEDFEIDEVALPKLEDGEILVRHSHIGLQPAARLRMSERTSYALPSPLGGVPYAQTVGTVIESKDPRFAVGDRVSNDGGWQTYSVSKGQGALKLDERIRPISYALGCLGASGMTGYVGLLDLGEPQPRQTVVVSAASGAVGSVVGQIARIKGCRAVGIAGGPEKCDYVVNELGFDACVDHRRHDFEKTLGEACPDGVDINFENVGGHVRDAVWELMNNFSRVILCGLIAEYNAVEPPRGPSWHLALVKRIRVQGFLLRDHMQRRSAFLDDATRWIAEGKLKYREDVTRGLANAPAAFADLLTGRNFGKAIIEISSEE